jgi:hypothetical protein
MRTVQRKVSGADGLFKAEQVEEVHMDQAAQTKTIIKPSIAYFWEGTAAQKLKETNHDTS